MAKRVTRRKVDRQEMRQALLNAQGNSDVEIVEQESVKTLADSGKPKGKKIQRKDMTEEEQLEHDLDKSKLASKFYSYWKQLGGPDLKTEYRFHSVRKYPFDFAHPATKVAIEINGGTFSRKRTAHNWGPGLTRDATKQNLAVTCGWRPFVLTADMISEKNLVSNLMPIIDYIKRRDQALQKLSVK